MPFGGGQPRIAAVAPGLLGGQVDGEPPAATSQLPGVEQAAGDAPAGALGPGWLLVSRAVRMGVVVVLMKVPPPSGQGPVPGIRSDRW